MSTFMAILAQTPTPQPPGWYQFFHSFSFPMMIVLVVVWMYFLKSKRGGDKELTNRLKDLKRGDRIQTIGGILGTVVDARENEVVVKVDETSNTKLTFIRKAIASVNDDAKSSAK